MAKIKDTITYPLKNVPNTRDMVIITDAEDGSTKNMYLGTVSELTTGVTELKQVKKELTSEEVKDLVTTPFVLVPASPNAETYIVPISILLTLNTVTTAFAFAPAESFSVTYTIPTVGSTFMPFTGAFLNSISQTSLGGSSNDLITMGNSNQDLVLYGTGNTPSATGDCTLKVTIQYTEMTI